MRRSRWGFALLMSMAMAAPADAADRVFVGGYGGGAPLSFANLDGSGGGDLATDTQVNEETFGLGIDAAAGRIYFAEDSGNRIAYANLDGSGGAPLNTSGATMNNPEGFAIDPVGRRVYWSGANKISYANLDGSGGADLDTTGAPLSNPTGVAVDAAANRIYWTNNTASGIGTIGYANLDGTGGGGMVNTGAATITHPQGLALDLGAGRVYWANYDGGKISFARLDGAGGADLDTTGATPFTHAIGVAIDHGANRIYWASYVAPGVSYANLDGTGGGGDLNTTGATLAGPAMPALLKAPAPAAPPAITGPTTPGSELSCSPGTWAPDEAAAFLYRVPQSIAYAWSRDGADVAGATGSTLTASETGTYRCSTTATSAAGSATQTSAEFAVATPPPPPPAKKPALTGLRAKRKKGATVFSFRIDQAATVTIVIRKATGKKPKVATLRRNVKTGLNKVAFRRKKAGRYRATFTPRTAAAGAGTAKSVTFRIVRRKR